MSVGVLVGVYALNIVCKIATIVIRRGVESSMDDPSKEIFRYFLKKNRRDRRRNIMENGMFALICSHDSCEAFPEHADLDYVVDDLRHLLRKIKKF